MRDEGGQPSVCEGICYSSPSFVHSAKNFLLILVRMKQGCTAFHPTTLLPSSLLKDFSSPSAAITSCSVTTATDGRQPIKYHLNQMGQQHAMLSRQGKFLQFQYHTHIPLEREVLEVFRSGFQARHINLGQDNVFSLLFLAMSSGVKE